MLTSCSSNHQAQGETGTRVITDCIGREVEIPEEIDSVACLYAFAGHVTALLGEDDKISAVVSGLQRDKLLTEMFPAILDLPVPFASSTINVEELAKIDPDIVFIRTTTYENAAEMEKLNKLDIPAVVIDSNTIEQQILAVNVVGEIFGREAAEKAVKYENFYREAMAVADLKSKGIENPVKIFHSVNEATRTDLSGSLPVQWMELVGVENVSVEKELNALEGEVYASLEQIYLWDPDVIICNENGVPEYILTDSKWTGLSAVKSGKVYQMPVAISRWGHPGSMETPLAIYWLGSLLYPELYGDISVDEKTREFYSTFFDYNLTDGEIGIILEGKGMRIEKINFEQ